MTIMIVTYFCNVFAIGLITVEEMHTSDNTGDANGTDVPQSTG